MNFQRIIFIFSLAFVSFGVLSQSADSLQNDTLQIRKLVPSIIIDYGKLLSLPTSIESKFEGGFELLINDKIPLILEVGQATLNPTKVYANGNYESQGQYIRFGTGYYSRLNPKNRFGITTRFAISNFEETATIDPELNLFLEDELVESYQRSKLSASWFEFVLYSDRKFNDFLSIGANIRFRYLLDYDIQAPNDVYSIPGYGRSFDTSTMAFNLFLKASF